MEDLKAAGYFGEGHARGATFTRGGRWSGRVHYPEEIIPVAQSVRGPGIISRAIDALDKASSGGRGGPTEVHIHNHNYNSIGKITSDVDVEAFLREIDSRIETKSKQAVLDVISLRRT